MADVIRKATNRFTKGLVMDFSPENTKNELLTHALNATLLTFNGNELSLQNDMGNGRVETAYLPEGYIPVGTCEYGGIIYIVSYNPLENKSQIGCFPSPERNISNEELGKEGESIKRNIFQYFDENKKPNGDILHNTQFVLLKNDKLNPGDKFIVCADDEIYKEQVKDLIINNELIKNPIIALNIVSIEDSGKITYLNSDIIRYDVHKNGNIYNFHILGKQDIATNSIKKEDIDEYRNVVTSGYSVFKSKTSGKLAILAELIMIDSYSVTHSIVPKKDSENNIMEGVFDIIISTEITPTINDANYYENPKLQYYYLQNSQGYIQVGGKDNLLNDTKSLFISENGNIIYNTDFLNTSLSEIYEPIQSDDLNLNQTLKESSQFNFPKSGTFHGRMELYNNSNITNEAFVKFLENRYYRIDNSQISEHLEYYLNELNVKFYYYDEDYKECLTDIDYNHQPIFMKVPINTYISYNDFIPNKNYNIINNINDTKNIQFYPQEDKMYLHKISEFIPSNNPKSNNYLEYSDVCLANIKIPELVSQNGLDLPFKYDYTIVPCMNYGKLQHLSISNTVDFGKLHAFNQSDFTVWKYRIDDNQLRLTFGADIYDTYETNKVDGLILEFYDCWGFAGSIEITDKKSYSGIFTKIIPLNSLQAIKKKYVTGKNEYSENFIHNINIKNKNSKKENVLNLNDKEVVYSDIGWSYKDSDDVIENDCGTLYSNIVYGVKTYLRRTTDKGYEFIPKKQFFLYTLPIYNDYYYNVNDFSNLTYPELNLILTYKLEDSSTKTAYNESGLDDGYNADDKINVNNYVSGTHDISKSTSINLTKYYKYKGTTNLYLEIGLKKDYEELNISYDPDINKYFSCKLQLLSDHSLEEQFTVRSSDESVSNVSQILNYEKLEPSKTPTNYLKFSNSEGSYEIKSNFNTYNFVSANGTNSIKINYEFIVGYNAIINDIRSTEIQATTVCALFHKNPDGEYNYEDFGVYEQTYVNKEGKPVVGLLSNAMFYNEGTSSEEVFGVCRQIDPSANKTMLQQCRVIDTYTQEAQDRQTPGILNSNEPLKQMKAYLGKLTFCQPHAHGLSDINGVNIHEGGTNGKDYGIPPEEGYNGYGGSGDTETSFGIAPRKFLFNNPKYNLSLNTKNSIQYNSEFISTLDWNVINIKAWGTNWAGTNEAHWTENKLDMREYTGFTGEDIVKFNTKMIETMKNVYAYNPDYDSLSVNIGNVELQKYNPSFTSNLVNTYSDLVFDNNIFNDFIYLGSINYSNYLNYLHDYSSTDISSIAVKQDNQILAQLQFKPGFTYCGTPENYYLISDLTYSTPVPKELENELEFSASDNIVIKHTDGTNTFLKGIPNKKALYGYNEFYNKMIQLDVANYTIDQNGTLSMNNTVYSNSYKQELNIDNEILKSLGEGYEYTCNFIDSNGENVSLVLNISHPDAYNIYNDSYFKKLFYQLQEFTNETSINIDFDLHCDIQIVNSNSPNKTYTIKTDSLQFYYEASILNDKVTYSGCDIPIDEQSYETLDLLVSNDYRVVDYIDCYNETKQGYNSDLCAFGLNDYNKLYHDDKELEYYNALVTFDNSNKAKVQFKVNTTKYNGNSLMALLKITLKKINFTILESSDIQLPDQSFVPMQRTTNFSERQGNKYVILSNYKNACLRGSSLTLNDLEYEPNQEGHRLFIRNTCTHYYNPNYRGKLYYRYLNNSSGSSGSGASKHHDSWTYSTTKYKNNIFMYTGPCFTKDNLN